MRREKLEVKEAHDGNFVVCSEFREAEESFSTEEEAEEVRREEQFNIDNELGSDIYWVFKEVE